MSSFAIGYRLQGERSGDDSGQVLPILLMSIIAATALTLAVLQAANAHKLERQAETASDAAALAAANRWQANMTLGPGQIWWGDAAAVQSRAEHLAEQNDAELVGIQRGGAGATWRITATVETDGGIIGGPVDSIVGRTAESTSTATVAVISRPLPPSVRGTPLAELARRAGVDYPLERDSALVRYAGQTCDDGVDTDRLSDAVKVAILQVEAVLGGGLELESAAGTQACLRRQGMNEPLLSPALGGNQIRLSPSQESAADLLRDEHDFCEPVHRTYVAPSSPVCLGTLEDFVTVRARLVPNP
jgi:hypothetical protein